MEMRGKVITWCFHPRLPDSGDGFRKSHNRYPSYGYIFRLGRADFYKNCSDSRDLSTSCIVFFLYDFAIPSTSWMVAQSCFIV